MLNFNLRRVKKFINYIYVGLGDLELDIKAYAYGALSVLAQGTYLTLAQKSLEDMSALLVLYITSYNTVLIFILASIFYEIQGVLQSESFSGNVF